MRILAIETSCDDTALALVDAKGGLKRPQFTVLKNIVSSQIPIHQPFGGVVPNLAKREHIKNLPKIFDELLKANNYKLKAIDAIAVTVGPGLEPALWAGIEFAKQLRSRINTDLYAERRRKRKVELIGANHLEGHIYSNILQNVGISFPAICLLVSGGHTILLKMDSLTKWKKLGETRDDAAGEAFDKVARLLGMPYPGGPEIQRIAERGNPDAIAFPRPMLREKNYDFSFSGLKTAVLYYLRDYDPEEIKKGDFLPNVAASFQQAAIDVLTQKTLRAAEEFRAKSVILCGGVSANKALQKELKKQSVKRKIKFFVPPQEYNTDNAAMIAAAAYIQNLRKKKLRMVADSTLNL